MIRSLYAFLIAAAVLAGAQVPSAVQAATLSYGVSLNAIFGPESGTGSFTINAPSSGSGTLTGGSGGITALDFKIDSLDFALNASTAIGYAYQGSTLVLTGLIYGGQVGTNQLFSISLGSNGLYDFTDSANGSLNTIGSISISQTPLPDSLPLLATGIGILAMMGWLRKRKAGPSLAGLLS
jgi:hypothetical protein